MSPYIMMLVVCIAHTDIVTYIITEDNLAREAGGHVRNLLYIFYIYRQANLVIGYKNDF